jgi:hypothetical protein
MKTNPVWTARIKMRHSWDRLSAGHSLAEHSPANFLFRGRFLPPRWGWETYFGGHFSQGVALGYFCQPYRLFIRGFDSPT